MNNPHKGDVSFEAGGKTYTLRFSHLALVKLETSLDKSLVQVMEEITKPELLRLRTIVSLLWAGLQKYQPQMTEEDVANLLDDIGGIATLMPYIDEAFVKAFGTSPGTKGTNPIQQTVNGTGTISSSTTSALDTNLTPSGTLPLAN